MKILHFLGELGLKFHIWAHWPKIRKICLSPVFFNLLMLNETFLAHWPQKGYKLRHYGLLWVLNTFLALSYPGKTDYDNTTCLRFFFKIFVKLGILDQNVSLYNLSIHVFYSIYYFLGFLKYVQLFKNVFC